MKAVLDTNVLISGVISTGVPHELLVMGFEGEYDIVVSVETLTEFRRTLLKYPERFHMDEAEIQQEVESPILRRVRRSRREDPRRRC